MSQDIENELQKLKKEVSSLQSEIEKRDKAKQESFLNTLKGSFWIGKKSGTLFLGDKLRAAIKKLFEEVKQGEVSTDTLSRVTTYTFLRFVRIGLFGIILSLLPLAFVIIQTYLLSEQNEKLELQNRLINTQSQLLETDRRSSLVFLMSNIMDRVDSELGVSSSVPKPLTSQLNGRIIALSRSFRPYVYYDFNSDSLSKKLTSPERGHLFIALYESGIANNSLEEVIQRGNFTYADLSTSIIKNVELDSAQLANAVFSGASLVNLTFRNSNLQNAHITDSAYLEEILFEGTDLKGSDFSNSIFLRGKFLRAKTLGVDFSHSKGLKVEFEDVHFDSTNVFDDWHMKYSDFTETSFEKANLYGVDWENTKHYKTKIKNSNLRSSNLKGTVFKDCDFRNTDLSGADLSNVKFEITDLLSVKFDSALVNSIDWFDHLNFTEYQEDSIKNIYSIVFDHQGSETEEQIYRIIRKK